MSQKIAVNRRDNVPGPMDDMSIGRNRNWIPTHTIKLNNYTVINVVKEHTEYYKTW